MYQYDRDFYKYINQGAVNSARQILPVLMTAIETPIESVLDVGCGAGAWLTVWKSTGADVAGLDGSYLNSDQLMIDVGEFTPTDLSIDFNLNRRFTLVQSLEVAEHLPEASAPGFVACLCRHGDTVMFSAAPPGQGGENHINEQPYEYWRELFHDQGYDMYDPIRHAISKNTAVMPWYRYNTFLYINRLANINISNALSQSKVEKTQRAQDISPLSYKVRKQLLRLLPKSVITNLAIIKKRYSGS